jgi:hypothetical protein
MKEKLNERFWRSWDGITTFLPLILTTITHSLDVDLVAQLQKMDSSQSFGWYVCQLFFCCCIVDDDSTLVDILTDVVVAHVDVFAPLMEDGVLAQRFGDWLSTSSSSALDSVLIIINKKSLYLI